MTMVIRRRKCNRAQSIRLCSCSNSPFHTRSCWRVLVKLLPCFVLALILTISSFAQNKLDRQVAVTIDDLPSGMADKLPAADITALTTKLLTTLREQKVPVVGFVNEKK